MTQSAFSHLAALPLADNPEFGAGSEVDILIGCDKSGKFFTGEMGMGEENKGPIAMNTSLGWVLSGPGASVRSKQSGHKQAGATYLLKIDCLTPSEDHQLTKFWDFESIGIRDKETATEAFVKNITFENGRYSVTLRFKENSPVLPDNYENTLHRFDSMVKHLKKDPKVFEECDSIVKGPWSTSMHCGPRLFSMHNTAVRLTAEPSWHSGKLMFLPCTQPEFDTG